MAATSIGTELTDQHRRDQLGLAAEVTVAMLQLAALLDLDRLAATTTRWLTAATATVAAHHRRSVDLATDYVDQFRIAEIGTPPEVAVTDWMPTDAVVTSLTVTGPVMAARLLATGSPTSAVRRQVVAGSAAAAARHALNGGRRALLESARSDPAARGWIRVTDGDPCAFCAMLAGRGPVYGDTTATFSAHDRCGCTAELIYRDDHVWPGRAREFADLYDESAATQPDPLQAFRRAYDAQR